MMLLAMILRSFVVASVVAISVALAGSIAHHHPSHPHPHARALTPPSGSTSYTRAINLENEADFLSFFSFAAIPDPSGGLVTYVNQTEAKRLNLYGPGEDGTGFRFAADLSETNISAPGRKSLRFTSNATVGDGLYIFHVRKGPAGCGVWPAIWTVIEEDWPLHGEVDILEWANGRRRFNAPNLHTGHNCTMPGDEGGRYYSGTSQGELDCDSINGKNGNIGCGIDETLSPLSSGIARNANGGGYNVVHRDLTAGVIRHWFFTPCSAPSLIRSHPPHLSLPHSIESLLGKPDARFVTSPTCNLSAKIDQHNVIMDIDFCGLAQAYWEQEGCLAVAPDCYSWASTDDATRYYKLPGQSLEFDIGSFTYYKVGGE